MPKTCCFSILGLALLAALVSCWPWAHDAMPYVGFVPVLGYRSGRAPDARSLDSNQHQPVVNLTQQFAPVACPPTIREPTKHQHLTIHQPMPLGTVHHPTRGLFTSASSPASRKAAGGRFSTFAFGPVSQQLKRDRLNYGRHKPYRFSSEGQYTYFLTRRLSRVQKDFNLAYQYTTVVDFQLSRRRPIKLSSFVNDIGPQLTLNPLGSPSLRLATRDIQLDLVTPSKSQIQV
ncbi:hypothetical protein BDP55DRAFT_634492 [Colletotrichum godetiae]|uniref:Uncharacterized protein n=1 Tax=Colletotrichum godetiae TaxID=1209918 RepID=A0AAJ0EV87_9PEZI|nr:uncharacterized protein BDP55DRAFT_634492 [Colletotrichum godetiae]KAK1672984.1 hypothetical protein BDP55DRAFT_634492 [Colletotrichum godetiae]